MCGSSGTPVSCGAAMGLLTCSSQSGLQHRPCTNIHQRGLLVEHHQAQKQQEAQPMQPGSSGQALAGSAAPCCCMLGHDMRQLSCCPTHRTVPRMQQKPACRSRRQATQHPTCSHPLSPQRCELSFLAHCPAPQGHEEIVWAVEVHGRKLFSASADKTIRVWDIETRRCEQVRAPPEQA